MWGSIIFTDSINELQNLVANQFTIVAMVDDQRRYQQLGFVTMGALLPPEPAIFAEIDRNPQLAQEIYEKYLETTGAEYIAALIAAVYSGKNIALYLPMDESMGFDFIQVFSRYWMKNFGITIGSTAVDSNMDTENPMYMANIANLLYSYSLVPFQMYCKLLPMGAPPSEMVVGKIMQSLSYRFRTMEEAVMFCMQYINNEKIQQEQVEAGGLAGAAFRVNRS